MLKQQVLWVILKMLLVFSVSLPVFAEVKTNRHLFENIKTITSAQLHASLDQSIVVDVRSVYEYQLFHIKTAINIPASDFSFLSKVQAEVQKQPSRQLVFYCNGGECIKSLQAARRYMSRHQHDVQVYHAGLKEWAQTYPDAAVLQGQSPVVSTQLIDETDFKKHLLNSEQFSREVEKRQSLLLDIRDRTQRSMLSLFVGYEFHTSLDERQLFNKYIARAIAENRSLLIYDAAGKQVEWLMYYLEAKGVKSYYFLEGGAEKYFRDITASL